MAVDAQGRGDRLGGVEVVGCGLAAHGDKLLPDLGGQPVRLGLVPVRDHQDAPADLRHVGVGETVADGDGQHAAVPFHRAHAVHEGAHQRQGGGVGSDLPAVIDGHDRPDLLADGGQHQGQHLFRAFHHVRVWEFLV